MEDNADCETGVRPVSAFVEGTPAVKPRAVAWIGWFCLGQALANAAIALYCWQWLPRLDEVMASPFFAEIRPEYPEYGQVKELLKEAIFMITASGFLFTALNLGLAFAPRKPGIWVVHVINLALAALSCVCLPVAIPLGIAWFRPDVQEWYGHKHAVASELR